MLPFNNCDKIGRFRIGKSDANCVLVNGDVLLLLVATVELLLLLVVLLLTLCELL